MNEDTTYRASGSPGPGTNEMSPPLPQHQGGGGTPQQQIGLPMVYTPTQGDVILVPEFAMGQLIVCPFCHFSVIPFLKRQISCCFLATAIIATILGHPWVWLFLCCDCPYEMVYACPRCGFKFGPALTYNWDGSNGVIPI